ncbi:MAG TPA: hypothetical protein VMT73_05745 [Anaerolineales bacterium]|nr:hypothetical protein [Anaerolineales bacterium]
MTRWRIVIMVLVLLATLSVLFLGSEAKQLIPNVLLTRRAEQFPTPDQVDMRLAEVPGWVSHLASFLTLFLFGAAGFYLTPSRVRNMQSALSVSWKRSFQIGIAGLLFLLLFAAFALVSSLARITFPLTVLTAITLFIFSVWGYLVVAYVLGRGLLVRGGWFRSPLTALLIGLLFLQGLMHVPYLGIILTLLFGGAGLGVVITTRFGSMQPWDLNPLLEENKE